MVRLPARMATGTRIAWWRRLSFDVLKGLSTGSAEGV
jgi:hypothetical protein